MNPRTAASLLLTTSNLLATIVLVCLQLAGVVHWSWWWIVAPLWLPLVVTFLAFAVVAVGERFR